MNASGSELFEVAEIIQTRPLSGEFQEVMFGSGSGYILWVKFSDLNGISEWIGKFVGGDSGVMRVTKVTAPDKFLISAGGFGYVVDASCRKLLNYYAEQFSRDVAYDGQSNRFIVTDGIRLRLISEGKEIWASKRIALDGIRELKVEGRLLNGLAEVGFQGEEKPFTLDLTH